MIDTKVVSNKVCPGCHTPVTNSIDSEFIENTGMCSKCDHLVAEMDQTNMDSCEEGKVQE